MGSAGIRLLLPVPVVSHLCCLILIHVVGVVVGILAQHTERVHPTNVLLVGTLHKGIAVHLSLPPAPHIIHYRTRYAPVRLVVIHLRRP